MVARTRETADMMKNPRNCPQATQNADISRSKTPMSVRMSATKSLRTKWRGREGHPKHEPKRLMRGEDEDVQWYNTKRIKLRLKVSSELFRRHLASELVI